jgi:hypothetical protein
MIGIGFSAFLVFLISGLAALFALHVLLRYRALSRFDSFASAWIAGWLGAWLGSPAFGHWGIHAAGNIYFSSSVGRICWTIPCCIDTSRSECGPAVARPPAMCAPSQVEMRKAS